MFDRATYDKAKRLLEEISYELDTQPLTKEQRKELKLHSARLSGLLLRPWLPVYWSRRVMMAAIVLFGLQQALQGTMSRWSGGCFFRFSHPE